VVLLGGGGSGLVCLLEVGNYDGGCAVVILVATRDEKSALSMNQMRRGQSDKLTRRNDLRALPKWGKMLPIAGNQIVGTGSIGAFDKDVIVWINRNFKPARRNHEVAVILNQLEELLP
jgi:hypothetical protein